LRPYWPMRAREPILDLPAVVTVALLALVAIHGVREVLSVETDFEFLLSLAFVPARWTAYWRPDAAAEILRDAAAGLAGREAGARLALARYLLAEGGAMPWTLLTYALLHGSWAHLALNGVWLAAFGTPVARRCGAARFLLLAALAALGGALVHLAFHPTGIAPLVGASAAVSGLTAAAARFVFAPGDRSSFSEAVEDRPRQSLPALLRNRGAALFIGVWFAVNLLIGLTGTPLGLAEGAIAWEAHIGGFLVGLLIFPLLDRPALP
jgi:membrane associated rhomboid family serine protease